MWSTLLLLVVAATSLPTALGYVSGPLPLYDKPSSSTSNSASSSAGTPVLDAVKVVQSQRVAPPKRELTGRPLQIPGVAGGQRHVPAGVIKPSKKSVFNNHLSPRRTKLASPGDETSAIHFPTSDEETRFKRQIGWQHPRSPFNTGRQDSFRGPQNNFGNSFDYPDYPTQWGNGNGNGNGNGRPNRPNFNGRPQQPNWGNSGGSPDYGDMPFVFDNGPATPRPRPSRPTRRPVDNARPIPNVRPTRPPPTTPPPMTTPAMGPATTWAGCRCQETPEFNPVCGQDRVTYFNPSRLRCVNSCGNRVEVLHLGSCITTTTPGPDARTWPSLLNRRS